MNRNRLLILIAALLLGGCSGKGVQVSATSDDRDVFEGPRDRPGASMSGAERATYSQRAPFISLSRYDWEYIGWLEEVSQAVARLRLPDSKTVQVELVYGAAGARPETVIECGDIPALDCDLLHEQMEALAKLPKLPAGYPHGGLVVRLSRLP